MPLPQSGADEEWKTAEGQSQTRQDGTSGTSSSSSWKPSIARSQDFGGAKLVKLLSDGRNLRQSTSRSPSAGVKSRGSTEISSEQEHQKSDSRYPKEGPKVSVSWPTKLEQREEDECGSWRNICSGEATDGPGEDNLRNRS